VSAREVAIIGAGPAGLAAAVQLKRYGIDVLLLEAEAVGGLLRNANLVENYPGFPGGIPGIDLARLFAEHLEQQGVMVTCARVSDVAEAGEAFCIQTNQENYLARILVIATGSQALTFQDFTIPETASEQVLYEILPVLGAEGKRFAIVGAGDLAFDYALNLGKSNHITILNRSSETRCLPLLRERTEANPRIAYRENTWIEQVMLTPQGELLLACLSPQGEALLACDYLVGAIGRKPRLDFLADECLLHVAQWQQEGRLYLIGDVKNQQYRQASIAIGDGVMAAMQIHQRMEMWGHYLHKSSGNESPTP
jgi:thioredoxin reductase (NADPH)